MSNSARNYKQSAVNKSGGRLKIAERYTSGVSLPREGDDLEGHVRALKLLYEIANITGAAEKSLDRRCQEIIELLPPAWRYPEVACARISFNGYEYRTANYREPVDRQTSVIITSGVTAGILEVGYLEARPVRDEGPFSMEERLLLDSVAERLETIIERARAEAALRESEAFASRLLEDTPLGIYILQNGLIRYTNPHFQKLTGYNEKELSGRDFIDLVATADRDIVRASTIYTLKEAHSYPCECRIVSRSGQIKWVMQTVSSIQFQGGNAVLGNIMDITERKYLERKMVEYEELNKMKGDLLATVSHELRTPLAIIKGYATMMLDYDARLSRTEHKEYLKSIDGSTDRLTRMVDNLLESSRLEAGLIRLERVTTSLFGLLRRAGAEARLRDKKHRIVVKLEKGLPRVSIDPKRIRQVLDNLIDNAIKYSPPETEVLVLARRDTGELRVSIADRGPGIPPGEADKIFDRMYRIERKANPGTEGIGLGLSICRHLVEAHGGRVWVESNIDGGSIFSFALPLSSGNKEKR